MIYPTNGIEDFFYILSPLILLAISPDIRYRFTAFQKADEGIKHAAAFSYLLMTTTDFILLRSGKARLHWKDS